MTTAPRASRIYITHPERKRDEQLTTLSGTEVIVKGICTGHYEETWRVVCVLHYPHNHQGINSEPCSLARATNDTGSWSTVLRITWPTPPGQKARLEAYLLEQSEVEEYRRQRAVQPDKFVLPDRFVTATGIDVKVTAAAV